MFSGIDGLLSQLMGHAARDFAGRQQDPLTRSIMTWIASVQEHVLMRWGTIARSGVKCVLAVRDPSGHLHKCVEPAIGACCACHGSVCLHHAMLDEGGTLLCFKCLHQALNLMGVKPAEPKPQGGARGADPNAAVAAENRKLRKKYLRVLGLMDPATEDEVAEEFRRLMVKHHPDRAKAADKASAQKRAAEISEAYHWLKGHPAERSAA